MASTLSNLALHVIFSTKNRDRMIYEPLQSELYGYMGGIIKREGGSLLAIGGMADHIHLLIKLKPAHAPADVIRRVKANSSKWINEKAIIDGKFYWQRGYAVFSVSESLVKRVSHYIIHQDQHHRCISFEDEYAALMKKHGVEYNDAFLLG